GNTTTSVCSLGTSVNGEKVCEDSTETKCKTSTKQYYDEHGCASLIMCGSDHSYSVIMIGLYTSIVFNIVFILIILYFICNKHNSGKQDTLLDPPDQPPTPPPIGNPATDRTAGTGLDNPTSRQSEHLYDSPFELTQHMEMQSPLAI
ncbi:unnamed protein product, partial [Meganyctiphanes norvegica]